MYLIFFVLDVWMYLFISFMILLMVFLKNLLKKVLLNIRLFVE